MAEKVTVMRLKVDLQCPSCYKKVKKILCKFPQIRDQVYDEKHDLVTITVVCCSPEKIRDKLCCKGDKVIKSIEIVELPPPPKPKPPEKPKKPEKPKEAEKPKEPAKLKETDEPKEPAKPKEPEKPKKPEKPPVVVIENPKIPDKPPFEPVPIIPPPPPPAPVPVEPCLHPPVPVGVCCVPCSEGYGGGPCYYGYGRPVPPLPYYDSYGYEYGYGYGKGYPYSRCDYFSEENPGGCTIM